MSVHIKERLLGLVRWLRRRAGDVGRVHGGGRTRAEAAGVHKAQAATAVVVVVEVLNTS